LAWLWEKVFGHGEAGLRSLSALIGTATVPVAWAAARELLASERAAREWFDSPRAGLVAAALVAVNPFFVWYSQEARSYSLLVLTATLTLLFLARRSHGWWALSAALALLTHYFAIFLIVPEAAWLLWSSRERAARLATGAVALTGVALIPLALHQRDLGHTSFIADISLRNRLTDLPKKLVTGELGTPTPLIGPVAGLIAVAAIGYALYRFRRPALVLLGLAAAGFLVPIVLAIGGADYLLPRNVIALYVPVVMAVAAGLAGRIGLAGAAVICAVAVVVNVEVATDVKLQRDDWRGAARALGRAPETRVVVVAPEYAKKPLRLYAGSLPPLPAGGMNTREVVAIVYGRPPKDPAPPPGFSEFARVRTASYVLVRYRAPAPRRFTAQPALLQKGPTQ
jgi:4-amino-4-deoxy-L-arabinose transferase-like glycosyltransferase